MPEGSDQLFRTMLTLLATGAGVVLGGGSVVAFEYLRDRLSTTDEVTQRMGLRVVSSSFVLAGGRAALIRRPGAPHRV